MDVTVNDLREQGIIYKEAETLHSPVHAEKWYPGITSSYGQTSNDPAWIINNWGKVFDIKGHYINEIDNVQDLNILRRPA